MTRSDADAVLLALKKTGGSADLHQLTATTGLPRRQLEARLALLASQGQVHADGDQWRLLTTV